MIRHFSRRKGKTCSKVGCRFNLTLGKGWMDGWMACDRGQIEVIKVSLYGSIVQLYYLYTEVNPIIWIYLIICGRNGASHRRRGSNSRPRLYAGT